jgi:YVTN family beta-propeller protein
LITSMRAAALGLAAAMTAGGAALASPFLYVPNEQQQLNVIDLASGNVVTRITTESTTFGIAATTTNPVFVTDFATGTLQVIDTAANATIQTLSICAQPGVPVVSPDMTKLLVPCRRTGADPGGLVVIDTATYAQQVVTIAPDPVAAAWAPDGSRYYVTTTDHVSIVNAANNQFVAAIPVRAGAFSIVANNANTKLYVASFGASGGAGPGINAIDLASGLVTMIEVPAEPTWIALNPAGTHLFVAMAPADSVYVIGTSVNAPIATINFDRGSRPQSVIVHPDGSRVYVELAAQGRIASLALPDFNAPQAFVYGASGAAFGSYIGAGSSTPAPKAPGYLSGLWWNPSESGWGIHVTKRRNNILAAWFTYDDGGAPIWYVAPGCTMGTPLACSGSLYRVADVGFFGGAYDFSIARIEVVGTLQLNFQSVNLGSMSYTVGQQARATWLERQPVATGGPRPTTNYTDMWWNPNESGWGLAVTHQPGNMFLAWYVYDTRKQPTWFVSSCATNDAGNACNGTLLRVTGPSFSGPFDSSRVHPTPAGTVSVTFGDRDNGVLTYTVDGIAGSKNITRELF